MRYDDLSALSPVVRTEVLNGELLRRVRETDGVEDDEIEDIVRSMMELSLDQIVCSLQDRNTFLGQIENARQARQPQPLSAPVLDALNEPIALPPTSRAASANSTLLDPQTLAATASAPEHPSTPLSFNPSVATPPRTASPTGSFATAGQGEKERLYNAVARLEPQNATEITDLLLSLNKKERALCLFNADYLNSKVESAKNILSVLEDDPVPTPPASKPDPTGASQEASSKRVAARSGSPKTPDLSYSRGPSVAASPAAPVTPNTTSMTIPPTSSSATTTTTSVHTLATLAKLPATEILKIAGGNPVATTGLPLPKADPLVTRSTDEFIDSIQVKSIAQQKQAVGDKLFKVIKAFGIKGAPKITILLLDTEDLRALAHLMNSYPAVLKEKVLMQAAAAK
jgi:polyadenylate-binding protein